MDGFEIFDFSVALPYMTATENGITFSKGVTQQLDFPQFAQLLINEEERLLLVRPCAAGAPGARRFYKQGARVASVRWNPARLTAALEKMMGADFAQAGRRINGEACQDGVLFDLNKSKTLN